MSRQSLISFFVWGWCAAVSSSIAVPVRDVSCDNSTAGVVEGCHSNQHPELRSRASGWGVSQLYVPDNTYITAISDLSMISRNPTTVELFLSVGGQPWHFYWSEGAEWKRESLVGFWDVTGTEAIGGIAGLSHTSSNMEVFFVANDNDSIRSRYWSTSAGWKNSGETKAWNNVPAAAGITALSKEGNHMEIFWAGNSNVNGALMHSYTSDGGANWNVNKVLAGSEWGQPTLKGISAISRHSKHEDVFWVTTQGAIVNALWEPSAGWGIGQLRPANTAHKLSGIATLARSTTRMNVFYIGADNRVWQAYWKSEEPTKYTFSKISDLQAAPGGIAAASMNSQHQEVFWTSPDGVVRHAWWTEAQGTWQSADLAEGCVPGGPITVAARQGKNTMEGFCKSKTNGKALIHFYYYA